VLGKRLRRSGATPERRARRDPGRFSAPRTPYSVAPRKSRGAPATRSRRDAMVKLYGVARSRAGRCLRMLEELGIP
jgi:hypothetical protein